MPGTYRRSDGTTMSFWVPAPSDRPYEQEVFESLIRQTIVEHELSDVQNVSLLSGGLDSAVITALSSVPREATASACRPTTNLMVHRKLQPFLIGNY